MLDLKKHPYFTEWTDPESGVKSYVLTKKVAPLMQSFYFTNCCLSADEKYLWFYAGFPPSPISSRMLGVVGMDAENPFIQLFPETVFNDVSPLVTPEGDGVYYAQGSAIWLFRIGHKPEKIMEVDRKYIADRHLFCMCTHLTLSADGKYLLIDGQVGNQWFVAKGDLETRVIEVINEFPRCYNHAQFSPTDPKLFSAAQDWWHDPITGRHTFFAQRIWVMDIDKTLCYPIMPKEWVGHGSDACHEWWSRDGRMCWTDYQKGVFRFNIKTEEKEHVWKRPLCHTHCDSTGRYFCADQSPYTWHITPCQVLFYDSKTGKETAIASGLPKPTWGRMEYHTDPHPQFSPTDEYIVYTTTVAEDITLAICPVAQLLDDETVLRKESCL